MTGAGVGVDLFKKGSLRSWKKLDKLNIVRKLKEKKK